MPLQQPGFFPTGAFRIRNRFLLGAVIEEQVENVRPGEVKWQALPEGLTYELRPRAPRPTRPPPPSHDD